MSKQKPNTETDPNQVTMTFDRRHAAVVNKCDLACVLERVITSIIGEQHIEQVDFEGYFGRQVRDMMDCGDVTSTLSVIGWIASLKDQTKAPE